jgi:fatty-acyl-CoA synthase
MTARGPVEALDDAGGPEPRDVLPLTLRTPGTATIADLLADRAQDTATGLVAGEHTWTWQEVVAQSAHRAHTALAHRPEDPLAPFHIGVLLENIPEYLFWLGGAALAGAVVVGINPTRRGAELASDITFTQCAVLVTDAVGAELLDGLDIGVPTERTIRVDTQQPPSSRTQTSAVAPEVADLGDLPAVSRDQLFLLLFTSGTTSAPKAVQCTQGRLADIATRAAGFYGFTPKDICYCPMPLFHGNAIMALWAPALAVGARIALTPRFSASRFIEDVRHYAATRFTYVGKAIAYVLATPQQPDDADNPLAVGFGTEASQRDRSEFERRFGCHLVEGYGSSEGGLAINRTPDTPQGALGRPQPGVVVVNPESGEICEPARFGADGRMENAEAAIGELVNRAGTSGFEGYWRNPEATIERLRDGSYWSGDLGYVDEAGYVWFAGRKDDWLRVDSENFAAAPIERILERHPDVLAAAVYAIPDPRTGDQVMAALELRPGTSPDGFVGELLSFLTGQSDLGTKWAPRFVRITPSLPLTATGKITKQGLRREAWACGDPVFWRPDPKDDHYLPFTGEHAAFVAKEFVAHGREVFTPREEKLAR